MNAMSWLGVMTAAHASTCERQRTHTCLYWRAECLPKEVALCQQVTNAVRLLPAQDLFTTALVSAVPGIVQHTRLSPARHPSTLVCALIWAPTCAAMRYSRMLNAQLHTMATASILRPAMPYRTRENTWWEGAGGEVSGGGSGRVS